MPFLDRRSLACKTKFIRQASDCLQSAQRGNGFAAKMAAVHTVKIAPSRSRLR